MEAIYGHFSSSSNGTPTELESAILETRDGSALAKLAVGSRDLPDGMRETLLALVGSGAKWIWNESVGRLLAVSSGEDKTSMALHSAEASLFANTNGIPGKWDIEFSEPNHVRCGPLIIQDVCHLTVEALTNQAKVHAALADQKNLEISFSRGIAEPIAEPVSVTNCQISLDRHDVFLTSDRERMAEIIPDYIDVQMASALTARDVDLMDNALDLLKENCGPQYEWVRSIIRRIGFFSAPYGHLSSSSSPILYGTVGVTAFYDPVPMAEMLVHEASHQHFFIAKRLGKIHDETDHALHFSPMAGRSRPLEPILLAFHALGNMALMYAALAERHDRIGKYSEQRLDEILAQANDLAPAIDQSRALTPLGRGLFEPLYYEVSQMRQ